MNNPFEQRGIHIGHLNIRSLWNKFDVFREQLINSKIDCLTLREKWLNANTPDTILSIPGYNLFRLDRQTINQATNRTKIGGGIAIYLNEKYDYDTYSLKHHNLSNSDIEMFLISIKTEYLKPIIIINIYRPPSGNTANFIESLNNTLENLDGFQNNDMFILGDMTLDMLNKKDISASLFKN